METDRVAQIEKRRQQQFRNTLLIAVVVLSIVLVAGGVGWHYFYGPCGVVRVETAMTDMNDKLQIFYDAYNIASSTSRIALAQPVAELQKIHRETENIEVPTCLDTAKDELILSMETDIQGFLAFMAQESDSVVNDLFLLSTEHLGKHTDELSAVRECMPFCKTP